METRELRYFIAVAEELHFGNAADRLQMAQPPLSRAIAQLERRLGVILFERSGRRVALSAPGEVLLNEGRAALAAIQAAELRTRRAAARPSRVVLAAKAGASNDFLMRLLDAYAVTAGGVQVDVQLVGIGEPERMLRDGRADVALLLLPFDEIVGFDSVELHSEGQVALLPLGHPLAKRKTLRMSDLEALPDLPLPRWPEPDGTYPDGPGAAVRDSIQLMQLIGLGRACAIVPQSAPRFGNNLAVVPMLDAGRVTTVIAWPPHSRSKAVADLVQIANSEGFEGQR
jgi:LysR family transcriptional regulator, benzoate and cis,cis-muconate-responsive activator of ben and cat genes